MTGQWTTVPAIPQVRRFGASPPRALVDEQIRRLSWEWDLVDADDVRLLGPDGTQLAAGNGPYIELPPDNTSDIIRTLHARNKFGSIAVTYLWMRCVPPKVSFSTPYFLERILNDEEIVVARAGTEIRISGRPFPHKIELTEHAAIIADSGVGLPKLQPARRS